MSQHFFINSKVFYFKMVQVDASMHYCNSSEYAWHGLSAATISCYLMV